MIVTVATLVFFLFFLTIFIIAFRKDRSRYRNCYLLFMAILSSGPFLIYISGDNLITLYLIIIWTILIGVMILPFFLIVNGIIMLKKEGKHLAHSLSLGLGILILLGEWAVIASMIISVCSYNGFIDDSIEQSGWLIVITMFYMSVIYGCMSFLIYMIYVVFLQIIPWKKDFDYVIIHGAGLINGDRVSKLLSERIDKAITVYKKAGTRPKLIPSGGKGSDESISEAEAMKNYLLEKGIPEEDIIMEDKSTTTYENLEFSKKIIDGFEGRKYTALVTSNYHVYRALRYCRKIQFKCTGIGSHVAFYYWPSALIREYIAVHAEKKHAIIFILGWVFLMAFILVSMFGIIPF